MTRWHKSLQLMAQWHQSPTDQLTWWSRVNIRLSNRHIYLVTVRLINVLWLANFDCNERSSTGDEVLNAAWRWSDNATSTDQVTNDGRVPSTDRWLVANESLADKWLDAKHFIWSMKWHKSTDQWYLMVWGHRADQWEGTYSLRLIKDSQGRSQPWATSPPKYIHY